MKKERKPESGELVWDLRVEERQQTTHVGHTGHLEEEREAAMKGHYNLFQSFYRVQWCNRVVPGRTTFIPTCSHYWELVQRKLSGCLLILPVSKAWPLRGSSRA